MILRIATIASLGLVLSGCDPATLRGSIAGGECRVFEHPQYAVRGLRPYDQHWVNSQVEGGVGGCGWARPAPRPPELDAVPVQKKAAAQKKPIRQSFAKRFKERVIAPFQAAPPVVASPPVIVAPAPEPPVPPKPRSAVDELLDPSEPIRKVR